MNREATVRRWTWSGLALIGALALGLFLPALVNSLPVLGRHIPQDSIERDYLIGLLWATMIGLSIRLWPVDPADRRALMLVWVAKTVVVLGAMLLYEWNYDLDAYGYYERSTMPGLPVAGAAWARGTAVAAQFAWFHSRIFPDSYHALKVTFALVGLIAVYLIYRGAVRYRGGADQRIFFFIALFPSVLFWSSIIGKDPLQLLGIALYAYGVLSWRATGKLRYGMVVAAGVGLAFLIRSWSGLILLFPLLVFAMIGLRQVWTRFIFTLVCIAAFVWSVGQFAERFNIETLRDLQTAADARRYGWEGGSGQIRAPAFRDIGGMLRFAPRGAFTALFRPLPGEVRNPFGFVAGLENLFLLTLLLVAILRMRVRTLADPVVAWAALLVLTWSFIYGFVSIYNFGAAVRFKLQILPILLLLLAYLAKGAPTAAHAPRAS